MNKKVLALDLEGTLISNAMSQVPRPNLLYFLTEISKSFERIVIFTTVSEVLFQQISNLLVKEGHAPQWFADLEYINWRGNTKDLAFIPRASLSECLLLDDYEGYIHEGQHCNWIKIECFESPYSDNDKELLNILSFIQSL